MVLKREIVKNWSLSFERKCEVFYPNKVQCLKDLLISLNKTDKKCSIKGSGMSYNDQIFCNSGIIIDLKNFNKIISINEKKKIIEVQSCCTFKTLLNDIIPRGFTIGGVAGSDRISIGGALNNYVHGKDSKHFGSFLNNVVEINVLLTDGTEKRLTKEQIPSILSFGLFYIILSIKLKLIPIESRVVKTKRLYFNNMREMLDLMQNNDSYFLYGWMDFFSKTNRGFLEFADIVKKKNSLNIYRARKINIIFKVFNNISFLLKFFMNKFFISIFNSFIFHLSKKKINNYVDLYDYYFPLNNIHINKFFINGIIEIQIIIEEKNFLESFKKLKEILNKYNIYSYFMGIKYQKKENVKMAYYKNGISFSIVFHNLTTKFSQFSSFISELNDLIKKKKIYVNLTKDFVLNNLSINKDEKDLYIKIKKKYDKNNILQSLFSKRMGLDEEIT